MSTYVIGDIHGQYSALIDLLLKIKYLPDIDTLIFVGDYIDWGQDSMKTLLFLEKLSKNKNVFCLLGNHDHMMLETLNSLKSHTYNKYTQSWLMYNNGSKTMDSYEKLSKNDQKKIYLFLKNLPLFKDDIIINDEKYYISHAYPISHQEINNSRLFEKCLWERYNHFKNPLLEYEQYIDFNFIHGHTPTASFTGQAIYPYKQNDIDYSSLKIHKIKYPNNTKCFCIDTGAKFLSDSLQAKLCCIRLEDKKEFYVNPYKLTKNKNKIDSGIYYYLPKNKLYNDFDESIFLSKNQKSRN